MAGYCSCTVTLQKVEEDITTYGMNLMNPPSSIDDLLNLLQKVESALRILDQRPYDSTRSALQPVMKALVKNELLRHTNEDVKVSVVYCITEISRIFAPKYPYDDHKQMEEILQQTMMALKKLPDFTDCSYRKVVRILEIFAKARVCVVLLDLENESLIIEIFKIFLEAIRPYHPHNIVTWMKEIMTRLIDGSGELSVELLRPLLDSLKIHNQMDSPVASILGEKVLKDCAAIVKPYFAEALKSMSLNSNDYAAIITLLCDEIPIGKEMMANENAPDTVHHVKAGPSEANFCEPMLQDDTHREKLKDTCTTNIMKPDNPEDVQPSTNVPKENQEGTGSHKLTGHPVKVGPSEPKFCEQVLQDDTHREKLKDTCTTNIMTPDNREDVQSSTNVPKENQEGTESHKLTGHPVKVGPSEPTFCEQVLQDDTHREKLKDTCTTNIMTPDNREDVQPATNVPIENQEGTGSPKLTGDVPQSQVQKKDSLHLGLTGGERTKRTLCATRKRGRDSRKNEPASDGDTESKSESSLINEEGNIKEHKEPSLQKLFGMKQKKKKKKTTTKMHHTEESGDKATKLSVKDENHLNECANYKSGRKLATRKHEDSKRARTSKDHGAELIGAKIKVWWPLEQVFYKGVISSFDSGTNKHKVIYDDGEVEKLRLNKERWEMLEDNSSQKDSKRPCTIKTYGKELVGTRIKIWWPLDERFYEGVISSFDSETNKHKVIYDDGEVEKLRLHKERWEMLEDNSSQKDSKRPCTIKEYGKELVGTRIKVWWPLDEMFYEGVISSFDPMKRKHTVAYDDGEAEKLRLDKERWEMVENSSSHKDHGLDIQGHAVSSAMSSKKKAKRHSSTGPNISSFKRS